MICYIARVVYPDSLSNFSITNSFDSIGSVEDVINLSGYRCTLTQCKLIGDEQSNDFAFTLINWYFGSNTKSGAY